MYWLRGVGMEAQCLTPALLLTACVHAWTDRQRGTNTHRHTPLPFTPLQEKVCWLNSPFSLWLLLFYLSLSLSHTQSLYSVGHCFWPLLIKPKASIPVNGRAEMLSDRNLFSLTFSCPCSESVPPGKDKWFSQGGPWAFLGFLAEYHCNTISSCVAVNSGLVCLRTPPSGGGLREWGGSSLVSANDGHMGRGTQHCQVFQISRRRQKSGYF